VRKPLRVRDDGSEQRFAVRAFVAAEAQETVLALGEPTQPGQLRVAIDHELGPEIDDALDALHEPRWHLAMMRIDRLASLAALERAALSLGDRVRAARANEMHSAEATALERSIPPGGGIAWWQGMPTSALVSAEALLALGQRARESRWNSVWQDLRASAVRAASAAVAVSAAGVRDLRTDAAVAAALASSAQVGDIQLAHALLAAIASDQRADLAVLALATRVAKDSGGQSADALADRLAAALRQRLNDATPAVAARGPAWFSSYERWGDRGDVARAANVLLAAEHRAARTLARDAVIWLARSSAQVQEPSCPWWYGSAWGSSAPDEIELAARVYTRQRSRPAFSVLVDGQPVRVAPDRRFTVPAGARSAVIRFAPAAGRIARLRIDGTLRVAPPLTPLGSARLERRFVARGDLHALELTLAVPQRARDLTIRIPLPAGLTIAGKLPAPPGAVMAFSDGDLYLHYSELRAGSRHLRVPLLAISRGHYAAAPAQLITRDPNVFALLPLTHVDVR
ncbi:MAG TPA: hypothetical protein VK509_00005, partial [Polyangiales bacterium]|nr:hypothetical protein [Polyangiales bacterium]